MSSSPQAPWKVAASPRTSSFPSRIALISSFISLLSFPMVAIMAERFLPIRSRSDFGVTWTERSPCATLSAASDASLMLSAMFLKERASMAISSLPSVSISTSTSPRARRSAQPDRALTGRLILWVMQNPMAAPMAMARAAREMARMREREETAAAPT